MTAGRPGLIGPPIGSPEWVTHQDMEQQFNDRAARTCRPTMARTGGGGEVLHPDLPEVLRRIWDFGVDNATRQINTALNLMMFDNQEAIEQDIAAAIAK